MPVPGKHPEPSEFGERLIEERQRLRFRHEMTPPLSFSDKRTKKLLRQIREIPHRFPETFHFLREIGRMDDRQLFDLFLRHRREKDFVVSTDPDIRRGGRFRYSVPADPQLGGLGGWVKGSHLDFDALEEHLHRETVPGKTGFRVEWKKPLGWLDVGKGAVYVAKNPRGGLLGFFDPAGRQIVTLAREKSKNRTYVEVGEHPLAESLLRFLFQRRFVPAERGRQGVEGHEE